MARKIDHAAGAQALAAWRTGDTSRTVVATAVRYTLAVLAQQAPGRAVEVRVPPFGAVQCVQGGVHTRGTPRAAIEMPADTWLNIVIGGESYQNAVASGVVQASGERTDISGFVPLRLPHAR